MSSKDVSLLIDTNLVSLAPVAFINKTKLGSYECLYSPQIVGGKQQGGKDKYERIGIFARFSRKQRTLHLPNYHISVYNSET
ncbi:hypothetical protein Gasu2_47640 [Galdieria sulphuraria]|nr:hypothetical protein Gasu2_47640 [Galdieria sulphuraria]